MILSPLTVCDLEIQKNPLWNHIVSERMDMVQTIATVLLNITTLMSFQEAANLYRLVERTARLPGEIAEAGVYHGGSALIMANANKRRKKMHLFDTFAGIPETTKGVDTIQTGALMTGSQEVHALRLALGEMDGLTKFHVGLFPESAREVPSSTVFSFVNLDMDIYQATLDGLEFFYPRMVKGGIIVCHDYAALSCPGVKNAVVEFSEHKPETVIDLWHSQVAIVKS